MRTQLHVRVVVSALVGALLLSACGPTVEDLRAAEDVEGLAALLESGATAPELRDEAAAALAALRDTGGVEALLAALGHDDPDVRLAAVTALGAAGDRDVVVALLATRDDTDPAVSRAAEHAVGGLLQGLGPARASDVLVDALEVSDRAVRAHAATLLGDHGSREAIIPLLATALDSGPVRDAGERSVASILQALDTDEAVQELLAATRDERGSVRDAAIAHLLDLVDDGAIAGLVEAMGPEAAAELVLTVGGSDEWLAEALDVELAELAAATRRLDLQLEPASDIEEAAWDVLDGGVAGAGSYDGSDGYHPAVVLDPPEGMLVARGWEPTALRFLELVVIWDVHSETLEVCEYHGPNITRYREACTIRVLRASDGVEVASETYRGSEPRQCESREPYDLTVLRGGPADVSGSFEWLNSIVNPPTS